MNPKSTAPQIDNPPTLPRTRFWVVWCPQRGNPLVQHETYDAARDEAIRLARLRGHTYYVLECVGMATRVVTPPPVEFLGFKAEH